MELKEYTFSGKTVQYYFDESVIHLDKLADPARSVLIVDDRVEQFHADKLKGWRKIIVPGNESSKDIRIVEQVVNELIRLEADRKTMLIGIGGGVITDLAGFVGSIYMRGIPYAFVPTTLLSQVDASIGGKNGVNFGQYKNLVGIIRQPEFLLFDHDLLQTLPDTEWHNGFAEIIKYACICDAALFDFLEQNKDKALSHQKEVILKLVKCSAEIKSSIVQEDEFESGRRRLLNFGHTVGHAVEKLESIAHGRAVAKGMAVASVFSERLSGLPVADSQRIVQLIRDYHLPVIIDSKAAAIAHHFRMDKKREGGAIHFILLQKIGHAVVRSLPLDQLAELLDQTLNVK